MSCRLVKRYMGGSTSFNGSTSKIVIADNTIVPVNGVTLDCWVKQTVIGSGLRVLNLHNSCSLNINNGSVRFTLYGVWDGTATKIPIGQWVKLTATYDKVNAKVYVNGVLVSTDAHTDAFPVGTISPQIGVYSSGNFFSGKIAQARFFNQALTATQVATLYATGVNPITPVAQYPLSDLPSTYLDTIGGATGTGTATSYSPDVPVQLRTAIDEEARSSLSFDGTAKYILVSSSLTTDMSFTVKAKTNSTTTRQAFWGHDVDLFEITATGALRLKLVLSTTNLDISTASGFVRPGWHIYTCQYSSTTGIGTISVDGQVVLSGTGVGTFSMSVFYISTYNGSAIPFIGNIKEFVLHSRALTKAEIIDLHFNNIVPTDGLVLNLELNEGAGTTAYDSSGNGNDGTITGATWSADVPSKAREVIGGNLVKNGDLSYQPPFVAETTASNVWIDGSASGSATNNLFGFATYLNGATGSVSFDEAENALKLVRTSTATNNATWVSLRKTFSGATPLVSELPLLCKIKPNTAYTFRFKRKQDGNLATGQAQYKYQTHSASAVRNINVTVTGNPTTEWVETFVTFTSGASDRYFECAFVNGYTGFTPTAGTIWIKNISLQETTLPTRATATTRTTVTCP